MKKPIIKQVTKGGNKQLLVYLPKKTFKAGEYVVIIKQSDIKSSQIVINLGK